jgi:hypothetical protein
MNCINSHSLTLVLETQNTHKRFRSLLHSESSKSSGQGFEITIGNGSSDKMAGRPSYCTHGSILPTSMMLWWNVWQGKEILGEIPAPVSHCPLLILRSLLWDWTTISALGSCLVAELWEWLQMKPYDWFRLQKQPESKSCKLVTE